MLKIILGIIYFIIFAIGCMFLYFGISSLKKAQMNDDSLYDKAILYFRLFILILVVNGIFTIMCFVLLQ